MSEGYGTPRYRWYVLGLLTLAYTVSFIDRSLLNLLVEPIREDLSLTDTQISLVIGLAFAIFYTFMGIPIAYWADRRSRRALIAGGIAFWSLMTAACGLARSYGQLFAARVGVGAGEATLTPAANSLITDYFPRHQLGRALAVYTMGLTIGSGLAFILGGALFTWITSRPPIELPVFGELRPWQVAFIVVGLPGLLLVGLMGTVREPPRRDGTGVDQPLPWSQAYQWVRGNLSLYAAQFFGVAFFSVVGFAFGAWAPAFFIRVHGWTIGQVGLAYGLVLLITGLVMAFAGGWLADRWFHRGDRTAHWKVVMLGVALTIPFYVFATRAESATTAFLLLTLGSIGAALPSGAAPATLMLVSPNRMRALISSVYLFVVNLVAQSLGPLSVALMTDRLYADPKAVGLSMSWVALIGGAISLGILAAGLPAYRRAITRSTPGAAKASPPAAESSG